MMRLPVTLATLLLVLSACSSGDDTPSPTATPTPSAPTYKGLVITPGRIGDATAGMNVRDALATGYFELKKKPADAKPCEGNLHWKPKYKNFDLFINADDEVRELGVTGPGAKTSTGITVGSSYRKLSDAYDAIDADAQLSKPKAVDGKRTGIYVHDGKNWIGFAFAGLPGKLKPASKIVYIQVGFRGKPSLNPADC
jgi:hypothetical protein